MNGRPLTGRKVLAIVLTSFGIVIAVNVFLAVSAIGTFPGLEVKNSYVASQTFDADRTAQEALGWDVDASLSDGTLSLAFTGSGGGPAAVTALDATVGRPTHTRDDVAPDFAYRGGVFSAPLELEPGKWNIRLVATAADGTEFRKRLLLRVPESS